MFLGALGPIFMTVDEDVDEDDLALVLDMLRDFNRIKVGLAWCFSMHHCISCAIQELKHLHMVGKKDIVYPESSLGGLKGLVKSVLDEYGKQLVEKPVEEVAKGVMVAPA